MPLSDHYARTERLAVQIVTCDPATQRLEGVGKDAAVIQISTSGRPPAFRWPKEGEYWVIERENADWTLLARIEEDGLVIKAKDGQPGDLMSPEGWIPQSDVPIRYNDTINNFEIRDAGTWVPYAAPGVSPEIFIGPGTPPGVQTMWVDTDEPGVDLSQMRPQTVTSLPATTPYDGQEIYFQDATMATLGVRWHLIYNAASGSLYKWEFVGGADLGADIATFETLAALNTLYRALTTAGPSVTVPLAGEYSVTIGAYQRTNTAGTTALMSYDIGVTGAVDADGVQYDVAAISNGANVVKTQAKTFTAGTALVTKYKSSSGAATASFGSRFMRLRPIRVG